MTVIEIIRAAEKRYGESLKKQELNEALLTLENLPKARCNEENFKKRNRLIAYIKIKIAVLTFFFAKEEDLRWHNLDVAKVSMEESKEILSADESVEDVTWIGALKDIMTRVVIYFKDVYEGCDATERGGKGLDAEKYCDTLELIGKKLKELQNGVKFGSPLDLFPLPEGRVKFLFPALNDVLQQKMRRCRSRLNEYFQLNYFVPASVRDKLESYDKYELCPDDVIGTDEKDSRILFISTPFEKEFTLLLNANLKIGEEKRRIVQLNTGWWNDRCRINGDKDNAAKRAKEVKNIFYGFLSYIEFEKNPSICAIYGVNDLPVWDRQGVFAACSEYAERHGGKTRFVIHDSTGNIALLREYNELGVDRARTFASNFYLSMPRYSDVFEALKEIGREKLDEVKKNGVFLGYIGISILLKQFREGDSLWENEYKKTSLHRMSLAADFLDELQEQEYLVPADWQWQPSAGRVQKSDESVGYDYDQIKEVMTDEIRNIIEDPELNIYNRCAQLVIYCLCAGEDVFVWQRLDDAEKKSRITVAVKVIATAMRCFYSNPEVEFSDDENSRWGGLCCDGGRTIKFKVYCIQDLAWTRDAILHELYHSIQHTMLDFGVALPWYKKTYHVSEERRLSWQDNNKRYIDIKNDKKNYYWIQTMEVDARDFACMCLGDQVYHTQRI